MIDRVETKEALKEKLKRTNFRSFTVDFKVPAQQKHPWKVCLTFGKEDDVIVVDNCCGLLYPIDPDDHVDCLPGYCLTKIGNYWYCVRC